MTKIQRSSRSKSTKESEEKFQKFLRPGALARMRDSRISSAARSLPSISFPPIPSPLSSPIRSPTALTGFDQVDGFPCFYSASGRRPKLLHRKKLCAAKSVFFVPPSPGRAETLESVVDLGSGGGDLVAAH